MHAGDVASDAHTTNQKVSTGEKSCKPVKVFDSDYPAGRLRPHAEVRLRLARNTKTQPFVQPPRVDIHFQHVQFDGTAL